jgi:hypothetical protein
MERRRQAFESERSELTLQRAELETLGREAAERSAVAAEQLQRAQEQRIAVENRLSRAGLGGGAIPRGERGRAGQQLAITASGEGGGGGGLSDTAGSSAIRLSSSFNRTGSPMNSPRRGQTHSPRRTNNSPGHRNNDRNNDRNNGNRGARNRGRDDEADERGAEEGKRRDLRHSELTEAERTLQLQQAQLRQQRYRIAEEELMVRRERSEASRSLNMARRLEGIMGQRAIEGGVLTEKAFDSYSTAMSGGVHPVDEYGGMGIAVTAVPPSPPPTVGGRHAHHGAGGARAIESIALMDAGRPAAIAAERSAFASLGASERAAAAAADEGLDPSAHSMSESLARFLPRPRHAPI